MTRVAIVGSRRRKDKDAIIAAVAALAPDDVVVSGGCEGPDLWAAEAARARGLAVQEQMPDLPPAGSPRWAFTRAFYARNERIVLDSDRVIAFPASDRKGGTEDTIRRAQKAGKPIELR